MTIVEFLTRTREDLLKIAKTRDVAMGSGYNDPYVAHMSENTFAVAQKVDEFLANHKAVDAAMKTMAENATKAVPRDHSPSTDTTEGDMWKLRARTLLEVLDEQPSGRPRSITFTESSGGYNYTIKVESG